MGAWQRLKGDQLDLDDRRAEPPAELSMRLGTRPGDVVGVRRYKTPHGAAYVQERRPRHRTSDVLVWGDVPWGAFAGVPQGEQGQRLRGWVHGWIDERGVVITRRGTRPWLVGTSKLVVRGARREWTCRTDRLTDVAMRRSDGSFVATTRTYASVSDVTDPFEVTLTLLLLHGRWLNCVRGGVSNLLTADPMRLDERGVEFDVNYPDG